MSKPIREVTIQTLDEHEARLRAVVDSGSFHTLVREDRLPPTSSVTQQRLPRELRVAQGGKVRVTGVVPLVILIEGKMIEDLALVSPDLVQDMLVGAKTMQAWDITVRNRNGKTKVLVGHDMRDPELMEID